MQGVIQGGAGHSGNVLQHDYPRPFLRIPAPAPSCQVRPLPSPCDLILIVPDPIRKLSSVLSERRSACRKKTERNIKWMRKAEETNTFTLSTNYLENYRTRFEAHYKRLRLEKATTHATAIRMLLRPDEKLGLGEAIIVPASARILTERERRHHLLRALEEFGVPASVDDVLRLLPSDPANGAIEIMADVRAYWQGKQWIQLHDMIVLSYNSILHH